MTRRTTYMALSRAKTQLSAGRLAAAGSVGAGFVSQSLVAVSGVIAANLLGPTDRGHLALLWIVGLLVVLVGGAGIPLATTFFVAQTPHRARDITRSLVPILSAQMLLLPLVQIGLLAALGELGHDDKTSASLLSLIFVPAILVHSFGLSVLQGQRRLMAFNLARLGPAALYSGALCALLVVGWSADLETVVAIGVASWSAGAALTTVVTLRGLPRRTKENSIARRAIAKFGAKALLGGVSPVDDLQLDQMLVGVLVGRAQLGYYVTGLAVTNLPRFIAQSLGLLAYPSIAAKRVSAEAIATLSRFFWLTVVSTGAVVLALEVLAGEIIPLFFGAEFEPAIAVCRVLLIGATFLAARRILADGARGLGFPGIGAMGELAALVTLTCALLAIGSGSALDVAYATLVSAIGSAAVVGMLVLRRRQSVTNSQADR